jgi:hypothetical protein
MLAGVIGLPFGALGYYTASPALRGLDPGWVSMLVGLIIGLGFGFAGVRPQHFAVLGYPAAVAATVVAMSRIDSGELVSLTGQSVWLFVIAALPTLLGSAVSGIIRGQPSTETPSAGSR